MVEFDLKRNLRVPRPDVPKDHAPNVKESAVD